MRWEWNLPQPSSSARRRGLFPLSPLSEAAGQFAQHPQQELSYSLCVFCVSHTLHNRGFIFICTSNDEIASAFINSFILLVWGEFEPWRFHTSSIDESRSPVALNKERWWICFSFWCTHKKTHRGVKWLRLVASVFPLRLSQINNSFIFASLVSWTCLTSVS